MVAIRPIEEPELPAFRALHNDYVDREESLETVRDWFRAAPELCLGAFEDGTLLGHCLGRPRSERTVELAGIAVKQPRQEQGIGAALLAAFEDRAARLGFERIEVGSAGGYVDQFYHDRGYEPERALVRVDPDASIPGAQAREYEILEDRVEDGWRHLYIDVDGLGAPPIEEIGTAFDDPDAIYLMTKILDHAGAHGDSESPPSRPKRS